VDIAHQRLLNQRIEGERFTKPEDVVRWMGAMQAQAYQEALWAIGLRTQAATAADVEQALAERKILRTWPMRGTLHFVPSEDAKWMLALLTPRILAGDKRRQQQLELDDTIIDRSRQLFQRALEGGRRLSRPDMMKLWMSENTPPQKAPPSSSVHLLPGFDEYLLGYRDRSAVIRTEHAMKVVPGNNGMFLPMVVIDGQVIGIWGRTSRKKAFDILIKPFIEAGNVQEGVSEAVRRYSDFLDLPLSSSGIKVNSELL
jgi:hypothetical protein